MKRVLSASVPFTASRALALSRNANFALPRNAIVTALAASCAIALLATTVKPVHARAYQTPAAYSLGALANISIVDRDTGRTMPVYQHRGEYWVAGTPGAKYSVTINNRLNGRMLAVVSVDGVNVLSGETAGVDQQGYVFNRYQSYSVSGWRKSDHEVAAFTFVASPQSYAERTGRPENVGTIGIAMFREKAPIRWSQPRYDHRDEPEPSWRYRYEGPQAKNGVREGAPSSAPAPTEAPRTDTSKRAQAYGGVAAAPQRAEESLGTGHGAREYDSVSRTTFERASSSPAEVIRIRYDSHANLVAMGVIRDHRYPHDRSPNPFPESYGQNGYVPDPPRWYR
ncbi:MAG: hypothetical protein ACRCWJ_20925 [Casimicrobium sp.]